MALLIDGDKLLRDLRLPYFTIAQLREMKVGDCYELFDVYEPGLWQGDMSASANAFAAIERVYGSCRLSGLWLLNIGNAKRRGYLYVDEIRIKLLPNRTFELLPYRQGGEQAALNGLRLFVRICRLAHRLAVMARNAGAIEDALKLRPCLMNEVERRCGHEVAFLKTLTTVDKTKEKS
ncbi:hypothetical protein [Stenoxybacter acetivorans]|uniref:hypothetical protein n=1 Tax=Stenoxybacter acetivorans TaxID=422441 RepID=UPI00055B46A3|nr:hypothetical protein [Stenoxybacter acetivorans]